MLFKILGACRIEDEMSLMLLEYGTSSPFLVRFPEIHPIWSEIGDQTGIDPLEMLFSPHVLMNQTVNLQPYVEFFYVRSSPEAQA